jgi:hypothetical protein
VITKGKFLPSGFKREPGELLYQAPSRFLQALSRAFISPKSSANERVVLNVLVSNLTSSTT